MGKIPVPHGSVGVPGQQGRLQPALLIEYIDRKTRCVNNLAVWDEDMETHWWRIIRYLDRMARNVIILSPTKFSPEFCARGMNLAGFIQVP